MRLRLEHGRRDDLKTLHPAYFALVMATGIVSIATYLHGIPVLPQVLFWLNALFLAALVAATGARILRYPQAFVADIQSHSRGVGFFTTVAAIAVFGTQLVLQMDAPRIAAVFWIAAAILWFLTIYGVLAVLTVKPDKPSLADGLNGGWLVSVVASQSVALLTVLIPAAGVLGGLERPLLFVALVLWLGGGALYLWIVTLIFFRYTFVRMAPEDLTPPDWINMGAVAISALVGSTLIEHTAFSRDVADIAPFVKGFTLVFCHCHVVDSDAAGARRLALPDLRRAARLRPALLGRRIPVGHVFRVYLRLGRDPGGAVPAAAVAAIHGRRRSRLGGDLRRARRQPSEPLVARAIVGLKHGNSRRRIASPAVRTHASGLTSIPTTHRS
jgi:tellurite resistance protein TehA-like permease